MRVFVLAACAACATAPTHVEAPLANRAETPSTGELEEPECPEDTFRESMCGGLADPDDSCGPNGDEVSTTDFAYLVDMTSAPEDNAELSVEQRARFRDFALDPEATRAYQEALVEKHEVFGPADAALRCCYQKCTHVEIEMDGEPPVP